MLRQREHLPVERPGCADGKCHPRIKGLYQPSQVLPEDVWRWNETGKKPETRKEAMETDVDSPE